MLAFEGESADKVPFSSPFLQPGPLRNFGRSRPLLYVTTKSINITEQKFNSLHEGIFPSEGSSRTLTKWRPGAGPRDVQQLHWADRPYLY